MAALMTTLKIAYDYRNKHTNYSSRQGNEIDRVVVHHFAGHLDPDTLLRVFKSRTGSCTYAIFRDGSIGYYTDEKYRPWTTSSWEIDKRAITIEVENDKLAPEWTISEASMQTLIKLLADICKRYPKIGRLRYNGTKDGSNLHKHCWYANTNCPGPYLERRWVDIVNAVNKYLGEKNGVYKEGESYFLYKGGVKIETPGEYFLPDKDAPNERKGYWVFVESDDAHSVAVSKWSYIRNYDKWCYYDSEGHMIYGHPKNGFAIIDGNIYHFNKHTGAVDRGEVEITGTFAFDDTYSYEVSIPVYTSR